MKDSAGFAGKNRRLRASLFSLLETTLQIEPFVPATCSVGILALPPSPTRLVAYLWAVHSSMPVSSSKKLLQWLSLACLIASPYVMGGVVADSPKPVRLASQT